MPNYRYAQRSVTLPAIAGRDKGRDVVFYQARCLLNFDEDDRLKYITVLDNQRKAVARIPRVTAIAKASYPILDLIAGRRLDVVEARDGVVE